MAGWFPVLQYKTVQKLVSFCEAEINDVFFSSSLLAWDQDDGKLKAQHLLLPYQL